MPIGGSTGGASFGPLPEILGMFTVMSFLAYTVKIVLMLRVHVKGVPDYFPLDSIAITLQWFGWTTLGFFVPTPLSFWES